MLERALMLLILILMLAHSESAEAQVRHSSSAAITTSLGDVYWVTAMKFPELGVATLVLYADSEHTPLSPSDVAKPKLEALMTSAVATFSLDSSRPIYLLVRKVGGGAVSHTFAWADGRPVHAASSAKTARQYFDLALQESDP